MALKVSRVEVWGGDIQDQVGGLADVLEAIGASGRSLECVIGRRRTGQAGVGEVFVTPVSGSRMEGAASGAGLKRLGHLPTLRVEGADSPGLGGKMMRAIAQEGVNVRGVSAAALGEDFVVYLGFDSDGDADRAATALKGLDVGGGKGMKRAKAVKKTAKKASKKAKRGKR
jgi:predicted amino acid-binding ACT domain protein